MAVPSLFFLDSHGHITFTIPPFVVVNTDVVSPPTSFTRMVQQFLEAIFVPSGAFFGNFTTVPSRKTRSFLAGDSVILDVFFCCAFAVAHDVHGPSLEPRVMVHPNALAAILVAASFMWPSIA